MLEAAEKVLLLNPSHYTMWNARKEALHLAALTDQEVEAELALSAKCLRLAPKSYCVWEHRRWCLEGTHARHAALVGKELALCELFHSYDSRNFHCWNYRRWLMDLAGGDAAADLAYTLKMIQKDFSNYSAWHQRSVVFDAEAGDFATEFEMIFNGIFTSPGDQSLWMYVYWLLPRTRDCSLIDTLAGHCLQLIELDGEEGSKWPLFTLYKLAQLESYAKYCQEQEKSIPTWAEKSPGQLLETLMAVDPMRRGFYEAEMKKS